MDHTTFIALTLTIYIISIPIGWGLHWFTNWWAGTWVNPIDAEANMNTSPNREAGW